MTVELLVLAYIAGWFAASWRLVDEGDPAEDLIFKMFIALLWPAWVVPWFVGHTVRRARRRK